MITEPNIAQVINAILQREGGFVDDPDDAGGATRWGVTQQTADDMGLGDVANLTQAQAAAAYRRMFADWKIDQMNEYYTFALVADSAVNHGSGRAIKWLQQALGIVDDGVIGPQTLQALDAAVGVRGGAARLYASILYFRIRFYGQIITARPLNSKFAAGWMARVGNFLKPWPWT